MSEALRKAARAALEFLLDGNFVYPTSLRTDLEAALAEPEQFEPVTFQIYKPTPPQFAIPSIIDAELPWVYDQDRASGYVASMWVTPVKRTAPPRREPLAEGLILDMTRDEAANFRWPSSAITIARAIETAVRRQFLGKDE